MDRSFKKFSTMLVLVLVISVFSSVNAFAASEERMDTEQGGYITVSNVIEVQKIEDEGNGDTIYIAEAPVTITFHGDYSDSSNVVDWSDSDNPVSIELTDNSVVLTEPGTYGVLAIFGEGWTPSNTAQVNIQITGGSPTGEPKTNSTQSKAIKATPTASKVSVDGKEVAFQAYNINDNNYFKLRDLAMVVNGTDKNFEVSWDAEKNAINLLSGKAYTPAGGELAVSTKLESKDAVPTNSKLYVDGIEVQLTAYNIGGNNYFKLRDIATAINFGVTWDGTANMIGIDTKSEYTVE
jgi:hypothetical protein